VKPEKRKAKSEKPKAKSEKHKHLGKQPSMGLGAGPAILGRAFGPA